MSRHAATPVRAGPATGSAVRSSGSPRVGSSPGLPLYLRSATVDMEGDVDSSVNISDDDGAVDAGAVAGAPPVTPQDAAPPATPAQVVTPTPMPPVNDPTASVPASIRAASTRTGMPDRIPPRVDTAASVTIAGWHLPMVDVMLAVEGGGGGNGSATVNGRASAGLNGSAPVQLRGVDQTDAGKAGHLQLVARFGGIELARSGAFSVSSVPQNWAVSLVNSITDPDEMGLVALNAWASDSGNVADLDQVKRMEQIEPVTSTGPFAGATQGTSSWRDATLGSIQDHHGASPRAAFRAVGRRVTRQVFIFKCARVAVTDIAAKNSGLTITREVSDDGAGGFNFDISKVGAAVTANGFSSAAASGSATAPTQTV